MKYFVSRAVQFISYCGMNLSSQPYWSVKNTWFVVSLLGWVTRIICAILNIFAFLLNIVSYLSWFSWKEVNFLFFYLILVLLNIFVFFEILPWFFLYLTMFNLNAWTFFFFNFLNWKEEFYLFQILIPKVLNFCLETFLFTT